MDSRAGGADPAVGPVHLADRRAVQLVPGADLPADAGAHHPRSRSHPFDGRQGRADHQLRSDRLRHRHLRQRRLAHLAVLAVRLINRSTFNQVPALQRVCVCVCVCVCERMRVCVCE